MSDKMEVTTEVRDCLRIELNASIPEASLVMFVFPQTKSVICLNPRDHTVKSWYNYLFTDDGRILAFDHKVKDKGYFPFKPEVESAIKNYIAERELLNNSPEKEHEKVEQTT